MSREVKRVPMGFDWPLRKTWWGFLLDAVPCQTCEGRGWVPWAPPPTGSWNRARKEGGYWCPHCEGECKARPKIPIPEGEGWQMWETTSEGSPISPVFATPEEVARWLADNRASSFGNMTATYEQWLGMIRVGSAPSGVMENGIIQSGVEFVSTHIPDARDPGYEVEG